MNIPVGTVRSRLTRARADLRAEMKNTALNHETIQKPSKETVRTPS
jgi:hypothetical protein